MVETFYDRLEVSPTASQEVIKGAYKYLAQRWHPDKNPDDREEAVRRMADISEAFRILSNPASRARHDLWITEQHAIKALRDAQRPGRFTAKDPRAKRPVRISQRQPNSSINKHLDLWA